MFLILLGNAGIVGAASALILGFVGNSESSSATFKAVVLFGGLTILWALAQSQWLDRRLSRLIEWALRRYTRLEVRDFSSLLRLSGEYRIIEIQINPEDWLANLTLAESQLRSEGIVVLGIQQIDGTYIGAPKPERKILPDDVLLLYGRVGAIQGLDERARETGHKEHEEAVAELERIADEETKSDELKKEPNSVHKR